MSRIDAVLDLIDAALDGDTSDDAMRWTPDHGEVAPHHDEVVLAGIHYVEYPSSAGVAFRVTEWSSPSDGGYCVPPVWLRIRYV